MVSVVVELIGDLVILSVTAHTPEGACPLAGNTVHMDKRFIDAHMPRLSEHLHYRIIDVSTIKELARCTHVHFCI